MRISLPVMAAVVSAVAKPLAAALTGALEPMLEVMRLQASRPHPPAPTIHNHAGDVRAGDVTVNPPAAAPAPNVHVDAHIQAPAAPNVDVHAHMPAVAAGPTYVTAKVENDPTAVQRMEIVGMPDRETTSNVERDGEGQIVKTTQRETTVG